MSQLNEADRHGSHGHPGNHPHPHPEPVIVTVDNRPHRVEAKTYRVSEFKERVGVAPERALDEIVGGRIKPLDDGDKVKIDGGEKFISHARCGSSA